MVEKAGIGMDYPLEIPKRALNRDLNPKRTPKTL
jgi:hypothetical protein